MDSSTPFTAILSCRIQNVDVEWLFFCGKNRHSSAFAKFLGNREFDFFRLRFAVQVFRSFHQLKIEKDEGVSKLFKQ